jgi:hypothetical protein
MVQDCFIVSAMPNISTFSFEDKLFAFVQALIRKLGNLIQLATPLGMKTIKSNKRIAPACRSHLKLWRLCRVPEHRPFETGS